MSGSARRDVRSATCSVVLAPSLLRKATRALSGSQFGRKFEGAEIFGVVGSPVVTGMLRPSAAFITQMSVPAPPRLAV